MKTISLKDLEPSYEIEVEISSSDYEKLIEASDGDVIEIDGNLKRGFTQTDGIFLKKKYEASITAGTNYPVDIINLNPSPPLYTVGTIVSLRITIKVSQESTSATFKP